MKLVSILSIFCVVCFTWVILLIVFTVVDESIKVGNMNRIKTSSNLDLFLPDESVNESYPIPLRNIYIHNIVNSDIIPMGKKEVPGGYQLLVPEEVVGWWDESALPDEGSNIVLMGHSRGVFNRLFLVSVGDSIELSNIFGNNYHYEITKIVYVREEGVSIEQRRENAKYILPTKTEQVTLITCANGTRDRLIVIAERDYE